MRSQPVHDKDPWNFQQTEQKIQTLMTTQCKTWKVLPQQLQDQAETCKALPSPRDKG